MNQRLIELAKQAGLKKDHGTDKEYIGDFDWQAYADLIIRECCAICDSFSEECSLEETHSDAIKKHFGV
jgi:hypothetical protein